MGLTFTISVKPGLIGKADLSYQLDLWPTRTMTPRELADWAYFQHTAYCHGVFDNDLYLADPGTNKTARANRFLKFAEVATIDIDSKDFDVEPHIERKEEYLAKAQLSELLKNEFVQKHCFLITPSSGNVLPDRPNWHLSFKLNRKIERPDEYRAITLALAAQLDVPTDHQTCKAAQLTAGTLFKNVQRAAEGYNWSDLYINEDAEEVDPDTLSRVRPDNHPVSEELKHAQQRAEYAEQYQSGSLGNERVKNHLKQSLEDREKVVLECLSYVLPTLDDSTSYEQWLQVWMSAHHGAATDAVCEAIINHPAPYWSDGEAGKSKFRTTWRSHQHTENGYTVASLLYLAQRAGWLATTGYEIDEDVSERINVVHINQWLEKQTTIPQRVLLHSQTGSGKTETLISLYQRLNAPKTVVFVPTIKLAVELAGKLNRSGLPTTLYIEAGTGKRLDHAALVQAHVLVTTLQTFAMRAYQNGLSMDQYGLVYIEESDQLLSQFARSGGSRLYASSHVTDEQGRAGFRVLKDALQNSAYVWLVDATMTRVSYDLATRLSNRPVRYVLNQYVRTKKTVYLLSNADDAYRVVLDALQRNLRVVVACDKRTRAKEVLRAMEAIGALEGKTSILITKDTEHLASVKAFMEDVEAGAARYDLVLYNSVMASGVSIKNTTPDVLVQFCEYLSPRSNLQILNRYRSQGEVYSYCSDSESFYRYSSDEILTAAGHGADLESRTIYVPLLERDDLASLRSALASISAADDMMQRRSPHDFYKTLLRADGRRVIEAGTDDEDSSVKAVVQRVRAEDKETLEYVRQHWREVPPIDADHPASPDASDVDISCGRLHAEILDMLYHKIPEGYSDEYIADVCTHFSGKEFFLSTLANQEQAILRSEQYLADRSKSLTSMPNYVTSLAALMTVRTLLPTLSKTATTADIAERAPSFLANIYNYREHYDTIFDRSQYKFDKMIDKYGDNPAELSVMLARVMLSKLGLKLKKEVVERKKGKTNFRYPIERFQEAEDLLNWRFRQPGESRISLDDLWKGEIFERELLRNSDIHVVMGMLDTDTRERFNEVLAPSLEYNRMRDLVQVTQEEIL